MGHYAEMQIGSQKCCILKLFCFYFEFSWPASHPVFIALQIFPKNPTIDEMSPSYFNSTFLKMMSKSIKTVKKLNPYFWKLLVTVTGLKSLTLSQINEHKQRGVWVRCCSWELGRLEPRLEMEFLELVNAGLLLTVQCVAAAAQAQSGLGWGDGGICRLKAPLWLPHSAAKTWWEFPKPTFFYCQEFCSGPIFSWLRLLEGEKYWNKSHHRLSSAHYHCWWYWHCWVSF